MNSKNLKITAMLALCISSSSCLPSPPPGPEGRVIPAEEFSQAMHQGRMDTFSVSHLRYDPEKRAAFEPVAHGAPVYGDSPQQASQHPATHNTRAQFRGDQRFTSQGMELKRSLGAPLPQEKYDKGAVFAKTATFAGQHPYPPSAAMPGARPGSFAPYHNGQMTANPSLWPDEGQGASMFTDFRAFQPMDLITILINEDTKGKKKAETDAESKFDILAGISHFFGVETKKWAANNTALDPDKLIQANTQVKFEGEGETKRSGTLTAKMSAVIMEVFPNGLMRIEGTKIVSIDAEEEVMVVSGLVRQRDIDDQNQVQSNRVANMRIDFYGQGLIAEHQRPGWGARLFELVWPF